MLDPRRDYDVTSSDVPAICGESPWGSKRSVMYKKIFKIRSPDTEATLHGKKYEPVAIEKFSQRTGARVEHPPYTHHRTYHWLGGTLDGIAVMPDGSRAILEVKCPISRKILDEVPTHYIGQVQSYMEIFDLDLCLFVQYRPAGLRRPEEFSITRIPRDRAYMNARLPTLRSFWGQLTITSAFANRVVIVLQRAWRAYRATKALKNAIKKLSVARDILHAGCYAARFHGFVRRREISGYELPQSDNGRLLYVEIPIKAAMVRPERVSGTCYVMF